MIRLLSSATGTSSSSATPNTPDATASTEGGNKSRLRMGLDWFQSQLLSADGTALPNFERRRHRRASQWNGGDSGVHRIRIDLDQNMTQYVMGLGEYSDKEYHDTFFDGDDLKRIFEQAHQIVEKLEKGEIDAKICTRGLDKLYGERQEACRTIRSKSINAVMDLQEEQWNNEKDDFEELAKVSREITKEAKRRAVSEARQDTRAAQSYLRDVDTSQWDDIISHTKTKSILKVRTSTGGLPIGQPLFPDIRNHNASFHDLRRSPFANCTTPIGRETTREPRRPFPSSPNTPMQRSKERLAKQSNGSASQSRRQAISEAMDHASEAAAGAASKNANSMMGDSNHSQASFALDDEPPPARTRGIRRSSSAGALAMKANLLPQNRNTTRSSDEEGGKGKATRDLERKRVPPNRSASSGENNMSSLMTPSSHRRRMGVVLPAKGDPPPPSGAETPTVKKRAPPARSKSDVTAGLGLNHPLVQQRRTNPPPANVGDKVESKSEHKTRAPPPRSRSGIVAGAKISRLAKPATSDGNEPESGTENSSKGALKKHSPRSLSEHHRKTDSSPEKKDEILSLDGESKDTKSSAKKKHLPRRNPSDLQRRGAGATEEDNSMAKIKIKLNKEITQNSLPKRRLSDHGLKGTSSGGGDSSHPESTSRATNGKVVQKKVPLTKSISEHGPKKHPSNHDKTTSEIDRKGKTPPKKTLSGRSASEHHRKEVSSDDDEIFSLDGSSQDDKVVKKKALPRRSISDHGESKHFSFDDDDVLETPKSDHPKTSKGTEVKKRMPPQRSASAVPSSKSSNARAPARERPE